MYAASLAQIPVAIAHLQPQIDWSIVLHAIGRDDNRLSHIYRQRQARIRGTQPRVEYPAETVQRGVPGLLHPDDARSPEHGRERARLPIHDYPTSRRSAPRTVDRAAGTADELDDDGPQCALATGTVRREW